MNKIAGNVARRVASQAPEARPGAAIQLASLDPAKVAAAVIKQLEARKGKAVDPSAVLASQIAQRLAAPTIQGSAPGATEFAKQLVSAVVDAVARQQQPKAEKDSAGTHDARAKTVAEKKPKTRKRRNS